MIPRYVPTYNFSDILAIQVNNQLRNSATSLRKKLAKLYGLKHVFLFSRASVALYALLKAYNRPGKVLVSAYNCIVVPEAVAFAGYTPQFVDIDYKSLTITAEAIEKSLTNRTAVVLVPHLFGIPSDTEKIKQICSNANILVVEDAAAAIGAQFKERLVGTFGDAAIISFGMTKIISGVAGGAILTNDDELASQIENLNRTTEITRGGFVSLIDSIVWKIATNSWLYPFVKKGYGWLKNELMYEIVQPKHKMPSDYVGLPPNFSNALVLTQLNRLARNLRRRSEIGRIYTDQLSSHPGLALSQPLEHSSPSWIQFPVLVQDKADFYRYMNHNGVDLSWNYRYSCAESYRLKNYPNAQRAAKTVLGLPTYPTLSNETVQHICDLTKKYPEN